MKLVIKILGFQVLLIEQVNDVFEALSEEMLDA